MAPRALELRPNLHDRSAADRADSLRRLSCLLGGRRTLGRVGGRNGRRLQDKWAGGPRTYLGLQVEGFPNLFTLVGPHNAATFCNIPRCIEQNVDWVTALIAHMREKGHARVEAALDAEREWTQHVHDTGRRMLFTQVDSWMMGINSNVAGKDKRTFIVYAGGAPKYRERCDEVAARGYPGFVFA